MKAARTWPAVALAAGVFVVLLATVAAALSSTQSSARRALENGFSEHAKVSAALTRALFASTTAASSPDQARLYRAPRISDAELTQAAQQQHLSGLVLLAADGSIIASSTRTPPGLTREIRARPSYIRNALAGRPFALSDIADTVGGGTVIRLAQPIETPAGRRVVVATFPTALLTQFISGYLKGSATTASAHAFLIDGHGRLIASSASANRSIPRSIEPALQAAMSHGSRGNFSGDEYFTASPVQGSSWRVVVTASRTDLFAPVSGASKWLPWALFAAFAGVLALVLVLVARLLRGSARQRAADARLRDQAERANRAKSEFLSRMSHELRTPLNAIVGFGQLLELDGLEAPQRESVEQILKGGRHLLELINEVLDISRIESGTMSLSLEPVHLGSVLADALSLIHPLAGKAGVRLAVDPAIADVHVHADRHRLKQVLVNVLSNAVKYNRPGGQVSAQCTEPLAGRIELAISDTGQGIDAEGLDRLFEAFDRLGAERTDVEGTGLGLALSLHLMQAMGGTIAAQSTLDTGTTMRLELGAAEPPTIGEEEREVPAAVSPSIRGSVVYIEDNPSNVRLIERAFEHLDGVRLISTMQAGSGLELVREHHPDLVLLDLHLPDLPGSEVLQQLKADPTTASIPVVIVSADATPKQIEQLQAAGATAYMTKPIDIGQLLKTVNDNLSAPAGSVAANGHSA